MMYKLITLLLLAAPLCANKAIVQLSVPKAGTHLLGKCIELITGQKQAFNYGLPTRKQFNAEKKSHYFTSHLRYTKLNKLKLERLGKSVKFFIYRDPRDQVVSHIFWGQMKKNKNYKVKQNKKQPKVDLKKIDKIEQRVKIDRQGLNWEWYDHLDFDQKMLQLTYGGSAYYDGLPFKQEYKTKGIADFYRSYMEWQKHLQNLCVVKFEDLIGPMGGGCAAKQRATVKKIAAHLGKDLTEEEVTHVIDNLFGGVRTFREGKIGSWRKHFKRTTRKHFKQQVGQVLIDLGYEKDLNW